ncbi:MAG: DUF4982 domain-containing protein [Sphingobacteriales bacterium]|nr:MAG: DUF4982 domain-containing protein [Sphingobacteriales bacterium]
MGCLCSILLFTSCAFLHAQRERRVESAERQPRERISLNTGWKFMRYTGTPDKLMYDVRPDVTDRNDNVIADTKPTEAVAVEASDSVLKRWILPTANEFFNDSAKHHQRPQGNPGSGFPFVQPNFNDASWQDVRLPHDWAIAGPFYTDANPVVGGGMGRLPVHGVAWYRRSLAINIADTGRLIYLDIDGAMSYCMVWLNGQLIGGWPYGYNSFRLDLTPYIKPGGVNQLAIRIDNPTNSSRWYPGAGLYRNVWLTKMNPVHIAQWGTHVTTTGVTNVSATVNLALDLRNQTKVSQQVRVNAELFLQDKSFARGKKIATLPVKHASIHSGKKFMLQQAILIRNPALWGPPPSQQPNMYVVVTKLYVQGKLVDEYETPFGIRAVIADPLKGIIVNGEPIRIQGVNQHHDLGAIGAAFNIRAAERQLEVLRKLGCNAIRMAHNPPAPELLDLADRMGFLVINEVFDNWERKKTPLDFHLIFSDWHEPDTRSFVRRDRNHPSVIAWSYGNEVGEQYTDTAGAAISRKLRQIVWEEDSSRPSTASMNYAKPEMPFSEVVDLLSLNYQGEGIRDAPSYAHLKGIRTSPLYPAFRKRFPQKMILSSETSSALSSRGTYTFPVVSGNSAPVENGIGGDPVRKQVSAYELYTAAFGAAPDKVFSSQDKHPYVAGEFVWTGWDYLGEPTPYYTARSSYSGIIDLAGFEKDRFYLYQARWRPEYRMAHILPHWNWTNRIGLITPVHVFSAGDEAELFLNNASLGKKKKQPFEYRFRWDSVVYQPGQLRVVTYKNGQKWASDTVTTTGAAYQLQLQADRTTISSDGADLSFIKVSVVDKNGLVVPDADNMIQFELAGKGEIVATDNGDAADMTAFPSKTRKAFSGLALVIIRSKIGETGKVELRASSPGLQPARLSITLK